MFDPKFYAEDHHGMRVSADGVIERLATGRDDYGQKYMLKEMLKHLHAFADRWYAGDLKVADEFFQLYCLDQRRPPKED